MGNVRTPIANLAVLVLAAISASALYWLHTNQPLSEPEKATTSLVKAAAASDLASLSNASAQGYFEDLIGHFGERKYEQIRRIYQQAYDLGLPKWFEYRQKAEDGSRTEYQQLHERVANLGREAFSKLPMDERMKLTEDRSQYNAFVFTEGIKALSADDRSKIQDVEAFREERDFHQFADRYGWTALTADDRLALGSPAALSYSSTPEKLAFLEKTGVPLLPAEQKKVIADIPRSELAPPRGFMLKYGRPLAAEFFERAKFAAPASVPTCRFPAEDQQGGLLRGAMARCEVALTVGGVVRPVVVSLKKAGFEWRVDTMQPDFVEIREAYPPRTQPQQVATAVAQPAGGYAPGPETAEAVVVPHARWEARPKTTVQEVKAVIFGTARRLLVSPVLWALFAALFIYVMTTNYRRLRHETFVPEWVEGEQQIDEVAVRSWWMRSYTRLTNRRILQVRLNWFFSKRKVYAVALEDVNSVVWRRYANWLLLLVGAYLVGTVNALALLLLMLGLEAKIHSIRLNTPFAQMPWTRFAVTSFNRKYFDDLARFYRRAQWHWSRVRTLKQTAPGAPSASVQPESDKDFFWGIPLWIYVLFAMALALVQRIAERHVSLDDYVMAPILLGLPIAIAMRSRRDALWAALLGVVGTLCIKFPGSLSVLGLRFSMDGHAPYFEQYVGVLAVILLATLVAAALAQTGAAALGLLAPLLWLAFVAVYDSNLARDTGLYAKCALAIAAAAALAWGDGALWPAANALAKPRVAPERAAKGAGA